MAFDFKKEYKDLYMPKTMPGIIDVPGMRFIAIDGSGDPNEENGAYQQALGLLYALCYTIKMSGKAGVELKNAFEYVVPPLEGLWQMDDGHAGVDYTRKSGFCWTAMIRQPEFVTDEVFAWACEAVQKKKHLDTAPARLMTWEEGLCVQCLHIGAYDDEPATVQKMSEFIAQNKLQADFSSERRHHEIYLGDPRRCAPEKLKTIIRHPVVKF